MHRLVYDTHLYSLCLWQWALWSFFWKHSQAITLQLGHNMDIWGRKKRRAEASASLRYTPGSGTQHPFRGLSEKQTTAEGFTQRGDCWRRKANHKEYPFVACGHMCACVSMHVCTYIIHVQRGTGQKNKEHNTYIKGVRGPKRPCLSLGTQVLPTEAPLAGRQPGWVGGWHTKRKAFHWNTAAGGKHRERRTDRHYLCLMQSFTSVAANETGINNKEGLNKI